MAHCAENRIEIVRVEYTDQEYHQVKYELRMVEDDGEYTVLCEGDSIEEVIRTFTK